MTVPSIPVRNVYYLLLYAWDRFSPGAVAEVGALDAPDLPSLLARAVVHGTRDLLRRGLDRGYVPVAEELRGLRGRIGFTESLGRALLPQGRAFCHFDEFEADVLPNRILKATLARLATAEGLAPLLRHDLRLLERRLTGVSTLRLEGRHFRQVQLHRNNARYALLMRLCELAFDLLLPDDSGSGQRFLNLLEDSERMDRIFEAFLRNFLAREQSRFAVSGEIYHWGDDTLSDEAQALLPVMRTDITLRCPDRKVVIDAKWYRRPLASYHGKKRVHSEHLYQLFAYLRHCGDPAADGLLVYPRVGDGFDVTFRDQGHTLRAVTLDLTAAWPEIHAQILSFIGDFSRAQHPVGALI